MRFLDSSTTALIFWPLFDQQKVAKQVQEKKDQNPLVD